MVKTPIDTHDGQFLIRKYSNSILTWNYFYNENVSSFFIWEDIVHAVTDTSTSIRKLQHSEKNEFIEYFSMDKALWNTKYSMSVCANIIRNSAFLQVFIYISLQYSCDFFFLFLIQQPTCNNLQQTLNFYK